MAAPTPSTAGGAGTRLAEEALGYAPGRGRIALNAFSAFSFVPPRREGPPELSYFNRPQKTGDMFTYDAVFRIPEDYDQYLPRCDRRHAKGRGLKIYEEERARIVPLKTSSQYGKYVNNSLDPATKEHVRVYNVQKAIYGENSCTDH
ncbi:cilia- and flagella-associated protein 90 [Malurus melanocephalus]|uniref:cilia- and flagella-associated protein 90 n=1 Tax=Malurus melanocephalus TaxID=175006 RepID=UPI002548C401|nr:cilia- and flagella-associated protein 90 [Malurus melanocephalus]